VVATFVLLDPIFAFWACFDPQLLRIFFGKFSFFNFPISITCHAFVTVVLAKETVGDVTGRAVERVAVRSGTLHIEDLLTVDSITTMILNIVHHTLNTAVATLAKLLVVDQIS